MASDYEYIGVENNKHILKEISTGVIFSILQEYVDEKVTLRDGDLVAIEDSRGAKKIHSIKERRVVGYD
jgi:hypothetical protein